VRARRKGGERGKKKKEVKKIGEGGIKERRKIYSTVLILLDAQILIDSS